MHREHPGVISVETFQVMLEFLVRYIRDVMFLPGHIDQWVSIMDLNGASMFKLPRDVLLTVGKIC
jgi:hypothetical protein